MAVIDKPRTSRSPSIAASLAALGLGLQAAVGFMLVGVLATDVQRYRRWFVDGNAVGHHVALAIIILVVSTSALVLALGVSNVAGWARIGAFLFEALVLAVSIVRVHAHPVAAGASLVVAASVIALLAWSSREVRASGERPGSTPATRAHASS